MKEVPSADSFESLHTRTVQRCSGSVGHGGRCPVMVVGVGGRVGVAGWKSLDDRGWGSAAWHNLRRLSSFGLSGPSLFVRVSTLRDASGGDGGGEGGAEGGGDGRMPTLQPANFRRALLASKQIC